MGDNATLQIRILAAIILLNFAAQVPYYLHLYYFRNHQPPNLAGSLLLGAVFALFVAGYALLSMHKRLGYGIGYLNLFASGYLLVLLFFNRNTFALEPAA